ncbi:DNA-processing protein DprA [Fervidobacterium thailandense]|uniref:Smf/DprA SLOG domain-containing protein n=1 Tax=Fervidobacterium thailandense TaxID=1008305 RepID=A0A1E3G1S1_9BACT|nr:DNA-processing protein DprA [Fervidobacterium thailandense]ODN30195.1 hypothetical protein A4H02_06430 [Fervidobacterium thailandense]
MERMPSTEELIFITLVSDIVDRSSKKADSGPSVRLTRRFWNKFATIVKRQLGSLEMLTEVEDKDLIALIKDAMSSPKSKNSTESAAQAENILSFVKERCEGVSLVESTLKTFQDLGIKVVTTLNHQYPHVLKQKLRDSAPPLLYYSGNLELCNDEGVAIVGSRQPNPNAVAVAQKLAQTCATEGIVVVSGGARGIDSEAHNTALEYGGNTVVFLSCEMLDILTCAFRKRCSDNRRFVLNARTLIDEGRLLLISAVHPNAKFFTGNAMDRNKFIYALSKIAFVVAANESGGTITGAKENLKHNYSQLWVVEYDLSKTDDGTPPGNKTLLKTGKVKRVLESEILSNQFSVKSVLGKDYIFDRGLFDFQ